MKTILIITDSYPPEVRSASNLMKDLAQGLKNRGHGVYVATCFPKFNLASVKQVLCFEKYVCEHGIWVLRIKTLAHHKVNFILRGISQLIMPYIFFNGIKNCIKEKIDIVIVHSPPLPLALSALKVKKLHKAKFILNLHDIFPQNAIDLGILKNKWLIKMFEKIEKNVLSKADLIVVPSLSHKKFLQNKRNVQEEKVFVIPHWLDIQPFAKAEKTGRFRKLYGIENKFIFLFAGVLGPSQGLDLIIRLAAKVKDKEDICFLFAGDGSEKLRLLALKEQLELHNVIFIPFVSKDDYPELVKDSDVGLVILSAKNTTPAVPAKMLGYMAGSLPVLGFLHKESDAHFIIKESSCGFSAISDNENEALEILLKLYDMRDKLPQYGENGFHYALNNFEKEICINKWENLF